MEVNGQLHAPAALFPGKTLPVPIVYEAGWVQEPVWRSGVEKNTLSLPEIQPRPSSP
jgi:hypothetical protein